MRPLHNAMVSLNKNGIGAKNICDVKTYDPVI